MKTNRIVRSVTGAFCVAILAGTSALGQTNTATTNVPPPDSVVQIKAGSNTGTDPDAGASSLTVTNSFYMDKCEVTKARFIRVNMLKNSDNPAVHLVEVRAYEAGK